MLGKRTSDESIDQFISSKRIRNESVLGKRSSDNAHLIHKKQKTDNYNLNTTEKIQKFQIYFPRCGPNILHSPTQVY